MSFRELRAFTEIMRTLGYPRVISMDNFRTPNFPLVADSLYWLLLRYDPNIKISDDIDTETQRVTFLTAAAAFMAAKARVQLKTKNLYYADGRAVKELLKVARLLYSALRSVQGPSATGDADGMLDASLAYAVKPSELSDARQAASLITEKGAQLHELLRREEEMSGVRGRSSRWLDSLAADGSGVKEQQALERAIRSALATLQDNIQQLQQQAAELAEDERALEAKLSKKKAELERNEKRLASLQGVRPAFMEEYERVEKELAAEHELYVTRFRNLMYLKAELAAHTAREQRKAERSERELRKLQKKLKEEELRHLRGDDDGDVPPSAMRRPGSSAAGNRPGSSKPSNQRGERGKEGGGSIAGTPPVQPAQGTAALGARPASGRPASGGPGARAGMSGAAAMRGGGRGGGGGAGPGRTAAPVAVRGGMFAPDDDDDSTASGPAGGASNSLTDDDADF